MFRLQKGSAIPQVVRAPTVRRRKYPFEEMAVGEYFFVPGRARNTLSTHVSTVSRQIGRKFVTRLTHMREVNGKWALCKVDDAGAVLGVGVWRTT